MNDETRERLGQSAKRSAAVRGQAGRGATMAGRRRPGAAEENGEIFCLPGFVADRGPVWFSSSRTSSSFMCETQDSLSLSLSLYARFLTIQFRGSLPEVLNSH